MVEIGCACGGKNTSNQYNTQVVFKDGTKEVFGSKSEARIAISSRKGGGTMYQVLKTTHPVTK